MKCSVAMSTYNGEKYLGAQLESIFAQTRPVDEIVISDDGSSDGTIAIIESFRAAHPDVRWNVMTSAENQGFRASFRRAIAACEGDVIFLCDQDDVWMADKVAAVLSVFEKNADVLSLISDFMTIDGAGKRMRPQDKLENLWVSDRVMREPGELVRITFDEMVGRNQGQGCAMAIRRSLASEYVAMDRLWTHDWLINMIAALHGGLYYMKRQLIAYRLHGHNAIGMPTGERAVRHVSFGRKLYETALAAKYMLIDGSGEESRNNLISCEPERVQVVLDSVEACEEEKPSRDTWMTLTKKRLDLIEKRRVLRYIFFWLTQQKYFSEIAYYCTHQQRAERLMIDLCAMKR